MELEKMVKQHDELLAELIQSNQIAREELSSFKDEVRVIRKAGTYITIFLAIISIMAFLVGMQAISSV